MFSHLELSFDLAEGKVTTETAAKDAQGEAYHKHVLDLATDSSISFTGTEVTGYRPAGEQLAPIAPTAAPVQTAPAPVQTAPAPVQQVAPAPAPTPAPAQPEYGAYDWTNPDEWKKFLKPEELAIVNAREWQTNNANVANQWKTHTTDNLAISEEWKKYLNPADNSYDYSGYGFAEAGLEGENDMKVLSIEE